eukprot:12918674-Prorocentrum_lima.AAC.1
MTSTAASSTNINSTQGNNDGITLRSNHEIAQENFVDYAHLGDMPSNYENMITALQSATLLDE